MIVSGACAKRVAVSRAASSPTRAGRRRPRHLDHSGRRQGIADDETLAFFARLMDESGAMLWGRVTYEVCGAVDAKGLPLEDGARNCTYEATDAAFPATVK
ncbi:MAG: hypothetical protein NVS1B5_20230 [Gemmatimonadaceae bacterium]